MNTGPKAAGGTGIFNENTILINIMVRLYTFKFHLSSKFIESVNFVLFVATFHHHSLEMCRIGLCTIRHTPTISNESSNTLFLNRQLRNP
jgi:hypothetical protein